MCTVQWNCSSLSSIKLSLLLNSFRWQTFILTPACSVVITVMWGCHLCSNVSFILFYFCFFGWVIKKWLNSNKKTSKLTVNHFSFTAESKPHGLVLQEDIWDADVDLHQKLLRRWRELKEQSGHKYETFGELSLTLGVFLFCLLTFPQSEKKHCLSSFLKLE